MITSSFLLWFFSLYSLWFDWPTISRMYSSLFPLAVTLHSRGKSNGLSIGCPLKHLQGPCSCHILSFLGRVFKSIKCHSISKWGFSYKHHFERSYISHCRRRICHYLSKESRETGHVRKVREIGGKINILTGKCNCGLSKIINMFGLNLANNVDQKECFYWKVYDFQSILASSCLKHFT